MEAYQIKYQGQVVEYVPCSTLDLQRQTETEIGMVNLQ